MKGKQTVSWDQRWTGNEKFSSAIQSHSKFSLHELGASSLTWCLSSSAKCSIPSSQSIHDKWLWNSHMCQVDIWINAKMFFVKSCCPFVPVPGLLLEMVHPTRKQSILFFSHENSYLSRNKALKNAKIIYEEVTNRKVHMQQPALWMLFLLSHDYFVKHLYWDIILVPLGKSLPPQQPSLILELVVGGKDQGPDWVSDSLGNHSAHLHRETSARVWKVQPGGGGGGGVMSPKQGWWQELVALRQPAQALYALMGPIIFLPSRLNSSTYRPKFQCELNMTT